MESEQSRCNNFYCIWILLAKGLYIDLNSISSGLILIWGHRIVFIACLMQGISRQLTDRFRGARRAKSGGVQFGVIRYSLWPHNVAGGKKKGTTESSRLLRFNNGWSAKTAILHLCIVLLNNPNWIQINRSRHCIRGSCQSRPHCHKALFVVSQEQLLA